MTTAVLEGKCNAVSFSSWFVLVDSSGVRPMARLSERADRA